MAQKKEVLAIRGHVQQVKYWDPERKFCVVIVRPVKDARKVMQCAGSVDSPPVARDAIEVYGSFDTSSKYPGLQFKMTGYSVVAGVDDYQLARYLISFTPGLGEEKATAIAKYFSTNLEQVLENSPERLTEVPGIGEVIQKNIVQGWSENKGMRNIKLFLMKLGLPEYKIKDIMSHHGIGYEQKLRDDPYLLMREGLGFSTCDSYAESLGVPPSSPIRYRGYITSILRNSITMEGHLFSTLPDLLSSFNTYNNDAYRKFDESGVLLEDIRGPLDDLILDGYVVEDGPRLYFYDQYFYEAAAADRLAAIMLTPWSKDISGVDHKAFLSSYEEEERLRIPDFSLSAEQREAVETFLTEKIIVVTGAPGTGKTTVVKSFVKVLRDTGVKFAQMAPTGKAAKRMEETTKYPAATIHRKLGYQGDSWSFNFRNKLPLEAILVDEFSMVDQQLLFRLIDAIRPDTKLVLIGDIHQLPSVGAGNVLRDLIDSGRIPTIMLTKVHRQAETSDIIRAANQIKDGIADETLFKRGDLKADVCMIETGKDVGQAEKSIVDLCKFLKNKGDAQFQVITPRNEGDLSVSSLNLLLQDALNPRAEGVKGNEAMLSKDTKVRVGDRIMVIKNHYGLGVYNGDVGKVINISPNDVRLKVEGVDHQVVVPMKELRDIIRLGYSSTIHKCLPLVSRIVTPSGIRLLGEIRAGDKVISSSGSVEEVLQVFPVGGKETYTLHTHAGRSVPSSGDHRHLVSQGVTEEFLPVESVRPGDSLVYSRFSDYGSDIPAIRQHWGTGKAHAGRLRANVPELLDEDFFWLMGFLVGHPGVLDTTDGLIFVSLPAQDTSLAKVDRIVSSYGVSVSQVGVGQSPQRLYFCSKDLREVLLGAGMLFRRYGGRSVPSSVWSARVGLRESFMNGIADSGGGTANNWGPAGWATRGVHYATGSESLARGVSSLLVGLGHNSYFMSVPQDDGSTTYRTGVAGETGERTPFFHDRVIRVEHNGLKEPMVDIEVSGDHSFLVDGLVTHNCQGSEYQYVILAYVKAHGINMLQRNLLYTALTRAKKKAIVVGQWAAVATSVENDRIKQRNTLLSERVKEGLDRAGDPEYAPLGKLLAVSEDAANFHAISKLLFPGKAVESAASDEDEFYTE